MGGEEEAIDLEAERCRKMHRVEPSQQMTLSQIPGLPRDRTGSVDDVRGLEHPIESSVRSLR